MFTALRSLLAVLLLGLVAAGQAPAQELLPAASGASEEAVPADAGVSAEEAVSRLLEVLRDEAARSALIERLEAESAGGDPGASAGDDAGQDADAAPGEINLAQGIAEATADVAGDAVEQLARVGQELALLELVFERLTGEEMLQYRAEILALALTISSTIAVFMLMSLAIRRLSRRLTPPIGAGLVVRARATAIVGAARVGALALAWLAGYVLASTVFATDGKPSEAQSLYLNAFALFGLVRLVLRALASPMADDEPVLSTLAPAAQAVIYRNLRGVAGTVIQGLLFVVPLAQHWIGFAAVRPLRTLITTLAAGLALFAIRRILQALDRSREDRGARAASAMANGAQALWRHIWPPLAVVYVIYCWFVAVSAPNLVEEIVLGGTVYSAVGLALLLVALKLMHSAPELSAPLPAPLLGAVPRLGPRADRIAMVLGWAAAALLSVTVVALVVAGWGWADIGALLSDDGVQAVLWRLASAALVALSAAVLWAVIASWIDNRLSLDQAGDAASARSRTLLALFRNAFTVAVAILAVMITLSQLGVDIAPLIAGAGVIGLAIGFGSQKLVQDIITGIFIQLENAMNEGDVVGAAGITGVVEKITIRSVRLRTMDGAVHVVPFSSVDTVTNLTRDFAFHVAEIGVAYKEKLPAVKEAMEEAFARLQAEDTEHSILEPLEMHGVTALGDSAVVVRARIKTAPGMQWGIGRRYTELVKEVLDERGIEIPFPHRQLVFPEGVLPLAAPRRGEDAPQGEPAAKRSDPD